MDSIESIKKLNELLQIIKNYEYAENTYQNANKSLNKAKYNYQSKLSKFDNEHKDKFIADKIGMRPSKPHGAIKLAVPVYLIKKSKYQNDKENYNRMYPLAEAAYREKYAAERNRLADADRIEQANDIKDKEAKLAISKSELETAKIALDSIDFLSDKLKSKEIVVQLIDYFKDHRVDTLKEAVNLWFDEKRKNDEEEKAAIHRQKMLELEEERVRAAQSAEEYARRKYEEACLATEYARQAAANAQDAMDAVHQQE